MSGMYNHKKGQKIIHQSNKICHSRFLWWQISVPPFICTIFSSLLERKHLKVSSNHISNPKHWISDGSSRSKHFEVTSQVTCPTCPTYSGGRGTGKVTTISHLERERMEIIQQSLIHSNSEIFVGLHCEGPLRVGTVLWLDYCSAHQGDFRVLCSPWLWEVPLPLPPLSSLATYERGIGKYALYYGSACFLWETGGFQVTFVSNLYIYIKA